MQLTYDFKQAEFYAGMISNAIYTEKISLCARETVPFGRAVAGDAGNVDSGYLPKNDVLTLTFSGDALEASNVINGKIRGYAIAPVTYLTSEAVTMGLIVAAIALLTGVSSAVLTSAHVITVETQGLAISASDWAVTAGSKQGVITPATAITDDLFRGVALHEHKVGGTYYANDFMTIGKKGEFIVETSVAVAADDTAYVDLIGAIGKFTNVSTLNLVTGGKFRSATTGAGLAKLDINNP